MSRLVSELTGADLALWVARIEVAAGRFTFDKNVADKPLITLCEGHPSHVFDSGPVRFAGLPGEHIARGPSSGEWAPHEDWSQGGPIIEQHKIELDRPYKGPGAGRWSAWIGQECNGYGDTALEAAMRAYVASVYGAEVPDEVEP